MIDDTLLRTMYNRGYHRFCEILIKDGLDMKQMNQNLDGQTLYYSTQRCKYFLDDSNSDNDVAV